MGYFNKDNQNRSGGGRSFGGNRSFGGKRSFGSSRGFSRPQMHDATCSNCGAACKLPFLPTGDKPVYCRDCFAKMGGGERSERRFERNDAPRPAFKKFDAPREASLSKADFDALNAKVDKILSLLTAKIAKVPEVTLKDASLEEPVKPEAIVVAPVVEKKKRVSKKAEVTQE